MAQTSCIECGYPFNGTETSCPECGHPIQSQNPTSRTAVITDEGDNEAENILRNTLNWIKKLLMIASIILGIVWVIMGFVQGVQMDNFLIPFLAIIGGALFVFIGFAVAKLIWAVGMIFINISTNVRSIKKSLITNK